MCQQLFTDYFLNPRYSQITAKIKCYTNDIQLTVNVHNPHYHKPLQFQLHCANCHGYLNV